MGATVYQFNEFVQLESTHCAECGVVFAMPETFIAKRRENGNQFYCPNGHSLAFRESAAERLRRELERERRMRVRAEALRSAALKEAEHNATEWRKTKTRLRNTRERIKNGVCPCCKRSFVQLARHMATKHPEFGKAEP